MKLHFVEAHYTKKIVIPKKVLESLPQHITLATDVQFINQVDSFKEQLADAGKAVYELKGAHAKHLHQILGCSHIKLQYPKMDATFFYIGDGEFHPKALLLGSSKNVYCYNPISKQFSELKQDEVEHIKKKEKGALMKFLHAKHVAVLITVKPGQMSVQAHLKTIYDLEKKYPEKKFHFLVFDTLDFSQLENFPFVEVFVNTACTRLIDDHAKFPKPMVNIEQITALNT